jgi:DNA polymerase III subunit gamma/tau
VTQVLARKWRPRTFSEMVGQEHVVRALENALAQQRLHHAYLFTGTRGVGKTTLARVVAKALNCETGVTATPCGRCGACTEIDGGRFVDLIELDAASNTQVDNMRELLENALYAPTAARYKVYIIDEVHMLSRNAFNAMLKTLEEPPQHVKFILATTEPQRVPVTVLSRCLQFNLKPLPQQQIQGRLQHILAAEKIRYEELALPLIARAAQGSMRDALSLLDQAIAHGAGTVALESARAMLGTVGQDHLHAVLRALAARDGRALIAEADRMAERSLSFEAALQELASLLHRLSLAQAIPGAISDDDPDGAVLSELASGFGPDDLQLYYQIAIQGRGDLALAPDEYAGFTMTLLRMLAFAPGAQGAAAVTAAAAVPAARSAAAPAVAPAPAAARATAAESKKKSGGDALWPELVAQLNVSGMAKVLAQHCELTARDGARVDLRISRAHQHLLNGPHQERLRAALEQHFGSKLRLAIQVVEDVGATPAAIADRDRRQRQAQAVAGIEQDPFVRELLETFDARVVDSTIKPAKQ